VRPHRIRIPGSVADLVRGLHPDLKRKVRATLDALRSEPTSGKPLVENLAGLRSERVGRFRIVYRIASDRVIEVVAIGPRRTIYEETLRLLRRRG
jgi:mRNA interferase RelE/StbE